MMVEAQPLSGGYDADSVAALIFTVDGRYLMQHRSDLPYVTFPGMWGLFGGSKDDGESAIEALRRELREELAFEPHDLGPFLVTEYDLRPYGKWYCRRSFYEVRVSEVDVDRFVLAEGDEMRLFTVPDAAALATSVVPFDIAAMILHAKYRDA